MAVENNKGNWDFYRNLPIAQFKRIAGDAGFDAHKDLTLVAPFIKAEDAILEIGAGYGRCLDFLLAQQHRGPITAIEQSPELIEALTKAYADKVKIIAGDIMAHEAPAAYDAALWLWSGIIDFKPEQQLWLLKHILTMLKSGGKLFIDIPREGVQTIAKHEGDGQHIHFETPFGTLNGYIPGTDELKAMAKAAGYAQVEAIPYATDTDKLRTMFILSV